MCISGHQAIQRVLCSTYSVLLRNHTGLAAECLGSDTEKTVLFPYIFNAKAWVGKRELGHANVISFGAEGAGYRVVGGGRRGSSLYDCR